MPALKHQREQLEWRVRKIQDRQEQLEEARQRRRTARDKSIEQFVADVERMFGRSVKKDDFYWWNLNPKPDQADPTRPEILFRRDRYSQSQKEIFKAIQKAVKTNQELTEG